MTLSQLIAKLIDLEIEHGGLPVRVRDGRGILGDANEVAITDTGHVEYVEVGT